MAKGRPVIGIAGDLLTRKAGNPLVAVDSGFADQIAQAGGVPIVLPSAGGSVRVADVGQIVRAMRLVNGLVIVGGGDVHPLREPIHPACKLMHPRRELADRALIQHAIEAKIPLVCIGSGMHLLNLHFGGTIHQHLPEECPRGMPHRDGFDPSHRHVVFVTPNTRLEQIYGEGEIRVNGQHHQGIKKVGTKLKSAAIAPDGLVEAIETTEPDRFCIGVQWHPESESRSALDGQLFEALVEASQP